MIRILLVILVACTGVTACGPERGPSSSPEAAHREQAQVPTVAAAMPTTAQPEITTLSADGWGPLRIGMRIEEVVAVAGQDSDPEAMGGPEPEQCDIFRPARAPEGLRVMIEDGRLSRISISNPTNVKTDRGLGPGDAAAEVRKAYQDGIRASPHEYQEAPAEYLTFWLIGGEQNGDVRSADARGIRYEVDQGGRVDTVHAGGTSIQYVEGCL